jgi:hypothetical protein
MCSCVCPQQGCGWRGRSLGVLDATLERSSGLLKRARIGQGYATRHARPCHACPKRSRGPLKAASLIFARAPPAMAMLHGGPTSVGRWRLGRGLARRLVRLFFCSIRSRYDQGPASRDGHLRKWAPRAHGVRCAHAPKGTARRHGSNYRCGMQSRCSRASIMHPPRPAPTPVLSLRPLASTASELSPTRADASHVCTTRFVGTGAFNCCHWRVRVALGHHRSPVRPSQPPVRQTPLSGISIAPGVPAHLNRWQCD